VNTETVSKKTSLRCAGCGKPGVPPRIVYDRQREHDLDRVLGREPASVARLFRARKDF
jgi:hypothetical protein